MRKSIAAGVVAASVLTGGAIGLTVFGPSAVGAKTGTTTTTTTTVAQPPAPKAGGGMPGHPDDGDHRSFGRRGWRLGEASAVAKAIGISESDLAKEVRAGKTIAQVAKAHGVATQKVIDALVADAKTRLAAAVKAGKITQAEANKIQTDLQQRITDLVNGTFPHGKGGALGGPWAGGPGLGGPGLGGPGLGRPGLGGPGLGRPTAAIAKAIGISESDLTTGLRSGKSVAQIAKAHGVTSLKVIDALVADGKAKIAAAVKAGRITKAQAAKIETGLKQQVTDLVNGTFRHGPDGDHRGPRFDKPGA